MVQYQIDKLSLSSDLKNYLWNLYHLEKRRKIICPFEHIIDYYKGKNYLTSEFDNKNETDIYKKIFGQ